MKVDPIHFFNERGHSILSADHLHAENARLRAEVDDLERKVRSLAARLAAIAGEETELDTEIAI